MLQQAHPLPSGSAPTDALGPVASTKWHEVEVFKEETYKSLNDMQENTIKQVKEINKTVQDVKVEIKVIKKTQTRGSVEMETLGKRTRTTDESLTINDTLLCLQTGV